MEIFSEKFTLPHPKENLICSYSIFENGDYKFNIKKDNEIYAVTKCSNGKLEDIDGNFTVSAIFLSEIFSNYAKRKNAPILELEKISNDVISLKILPVDPLNLAISMSSSFKIPDEYDKKILTVKFGLASPNENKSININMKSSITSDFTKETTKGGSFIKDDITPKEPPVNFLNHISKTEMQIKTLESIITNVKMTHDAVYNKILEESSNLSTKITTLEQGLLMTNKNLPLLNDEFIKINRQTVDQFANEINKCNAILETNIKLFHGKISDLFQEATSDIKKEIHDCQNFLENNSNKQSFLENNSQLANFTIEYMLKTQYNLENKVNFLEKQNEAMLITIQALIEKNKFLIKQNESSNSLIEMLLEKDKIWKDKFDKEEKIDKQLLEEIKTINSDFTKKDEILLEKQDNLIKSLKEIDGKCADLNDRFFHASCTLDELKQHKEKLSKAFNEIIKM